MKKIAKWLWSHKIKSILIIVGLIVISSIVINATKPPKINKSVVTRGSIEEIVDSAGRIKANETTTLSFPIASKITWIGVKEGDTVKKFQAVASVDKREVEKSVKLKLLDYLSTRWDFEQTQDDHNIDGRKLDQVTLSDAEKRVLEQSQFGLDQAVLNYEIANLAIEQSVLISPIAGTVTSASNLVPGERLSASDVATRTIKVTNLGTLYFQAEVDETDFANIKEGMKARIMLDSFPDATVSGTVRLVGKEGVKKTGGGVQVMIDVALDPSSLSLIPELTGDIEIITKTKSQTLMIDKKFVTKKDDQYTVQIMKNGKPETKTITIGLTNTKTYEVLSGLSEGEEVIQLVK